MDGGVKLGGAVALQQPQQGGGDGSEIVTALGGVQECAFQAIVITDSRRS